MTYKSWCASFRNYGSQRDSISRKVSFTLFNCCIVLLSISLHENTSNDTTLLLYMFYRPNISRRRRQKIVVLSVTVSFSYQQCTVSRGLYSLLLSWIGIESDADGVEFSNKASAQAGIALRPLSTDRLLQIHLYSAARSAHQSEALPVRKIQRKENNLERTKTSTCRQRLQDKTEVPTIKFVHFLISEKTQLLGLEKVGSNHTSDFYRLI